MEDWTSDLVSLVREARMLAKETQMKKAVAARVQVLSAMIEQQLPPESQPEPCGMVMDEMVASGMIRLQSTYSFRHCPLHEYQ